MSVWLLFRQQYNVNEIPHKTNMTVRQPLDSKHNVHKIPHKMNMTMSCPLDRLHNVHEISHIMITSLWQAFEQKTY